MSGEQTDHSLPGYDPVDLRPLPISCLPAGREVSCRVRVCWRI